MERTKDSSGEETLEAILDDVNEYAKDVPQFDDITMIILAVKDTKKQ